MKKSYSQELNVRGSRVLLRMMSKTKRGVLVASVYFPDGDYLTGKENAV